MLQIAVCDDDTEFLKVLEALLYHAFQGLNQVCKITAFNDGRALVNAVEKQGRLFDTVFLDVDMPGISGFQTAASLRRMNTVFTLVFITNLECHVREGYKYNAYRYIFKNNLEAEVSEAVSALTSKLRTQAEDDETIRYKHRSAGVFETVGIRKSDILYFRLEKTRRVILRTICSEYALLTKPLSEYQKELENDSFCLLVRNYLVNFNRVADIEGDFFVMEDGEKIPLGYAKDTRTASKAKYMRFVEGRI